MLKRSVCLMALVLPVIAAFTRVSPGAVATDAPAVDVRRIPNGGFQPDLAVGRDGAIHLWYEIDFNWMGIRTLQALGLAWDLKLPATLRRDRAAA